jgi:hypothetical protein
LTRRTIRHPQPTCAPIAASSSGAANSVSEVVVGSAVVVVVGSAAVVVGAGVVSAVAGAVCDAKIEAASIKKTTLLPQNAPVNSKGNQVACGWSISAAKGLF